MPLTSCPECGQSISAAAASCPHCGFPFGPPRVPKAERSTGQKWAIGCAIAAGVMFLGLPVLGILAGMLLPAIAAARAKARAVRCRANLEMIVDAKQAIAEAKQLPNGTPVDVTEVKKVVAEKNVGRDPVCPTGGDYDYGVVGETPTCSVGGDHALPVAPASSAGPAPSAGPVSRGPPAGGR